MKREIDVILKIKIDTDFNEVSNIVDSLSFNVVGDVLTEVKSCEVINFFEY